MSDSVGAITAQVRARLSNAEARLYPMAMTDPEGYERAVSLVGLVADELREQCPDVESVLQRRDALITRLPELADANGLEVGGLPADVVVDAASALRCREVHSQP